MEEQLRALESALTRLKCSADPRDRALTASCSDKLEVARRRARMLRRAHSRGRFSWHEETDFQRSKRRSFSSQAQTLMSLGESVDEESEICDEPIPGRSRVYSTNDVLSGRVFRKVKPRAALPPELLLKDKSAEESLKLSDPES